MDVLILLRRHLLLILIVLLVIQIVAEENFDIFSLRCRSDIVVLNEFLLLADHVLQVNDRSSLQLKVE